MSYIVPRDKPKKCTSCPFIDKITYDCRLMYSNDYTSFETQYNHCPLVEVVFDMEQAEMVDRMIEKNK